MRDILRGFPVIIELFSLVTCLIMLWGHFKNRKVTKKLKMQYGTDIISRETSKETLDELKVANRLIFIGFITLLVIRVIGVLIYVE